MQQFYSLKVVEKRWETKDACTFRLGLPIFQRKAFLFKPGQYITLKLKIGEGEYRRSYSMCNIPEDGNFLEITVKAIPNGVATNYLLHEVEVGQSLETSTPEGRFLWQVEQELKRHYVFVAAGSGITPILSHIRNFLRNEPEAKLLLLYGNKSPEDTIFKTRLDALAHEHSGRLSVQYFYSQQEIAGSDHGRITPEEVEKRAREFSGHPAKCIFFLCGPGEMVQQVREYLHKWLIPRKHILSELFVSTTKNILANMSNSSVDAEVKIILDGEEHMVHVPAGKRILHAALDAGLDAPYSCQGGVCCTCMARAEGKFDTSANLSLTPADFEEGFILTCSTFVLSPTAVVNYDEV